MPPQLVHVELAKGLEPSTTCFKAECIRNPFMRPAGGWKHVGDVEIAVAEYVDWYNHRRLHGEIGHVPPVEYEQTYWVDQTPSHYPDSAVLAEAGTR